MDDKELSNLKQNVELGLIASMDLEDLEPKIKDLGEAVKLLLAVTTDLVGRLPDEDAAEYEDDIAHIGMLVRYWI